MLLGLEPDHVRVVAPDVGGGFGGKGLRVEDVLVGWLARSDRPPVRWTETRSENMVAMHHGRAQRIEFKLGGSRDGRSRRCGCGSCRTPARTPASARSCPT